MIPDNDCEIVEFDGDQCPECFGTVFLKHTEPDWEETVGIYECCSCGLLLDPGELIPREDAFVELTDPDLIVTECPDEDDLDSYAVGE